MKILYLSSWFPCPSDNGSKLRIYNLLRGLCERHDVSLLSFVNSNETIDLEALRTLCRVVGVVPRTNFQPSRVRAIAAYLHPSPRSQVDTHSRVFAEQARAEIQANRYDLLIASQVSTIEYGLLSAGVPRVMEEIELGTHLDALVQAPTAFRRMLKGLTLAKLTWYLRRRLPRYDGVTVASSIELEHVKCVVPDHRTLRVVPNGVDTVRLQPNTTKREAGSLIYSGALTFNANYDAMRYFLAEIWPQILSGGQDKLRTSGSSPSLRITGSTKGVDLAPLRFSGVTFTGYVDDIAREVGRARVCVVPLRIGGGTRLKILEAMALGTPVVSTSKGAEGLDVTHGDNILIADDPKAFAAHVLRLLFDDDLRRTIVRSARVLVEARYDWGMIGQQFCNLVESVAAKRMSDISK